jgi:colanic acid/amylovoran biosynthesis glycosyltransferase
MNIAVIVGAFPQISETFVLNHIVSLIDAGHKVTIFATHINKDSTQHTLVKDYNLINKVVERPNPHIGFKRIFKIIHYLFRYRNQFTNLINCFNPKYYGSYALKGYFIFEAIPFLKFSPDQFDLIHAHFGENGNKLAYLKEIGVISSKLIVSFHGHDVNHKQLVKEQNYYQALQGKADALIFNSKFLLNKFKSITVLNIPCYQIPVGINPTLFTTKSTFNKQHCIRFITVGRLVDCKGNHLVLKALKNLNLNNFEYHIVGHGPNLLSLKTLAKNTGIANNVFFHGKLGQNDVTKKLNECDVFILFGVTDSNGEIDAQGLVVQEAQACGLPAIVSNGGGLPEGVINNKTGFIVEEGNIKKLEEKIKYFITNPIEMEKMGRTASFFAIENYNQQAINNKTFEVYHKVLKTNKC